MVFLHYHNTKDLSYAFLPSPAMRLTKPQKNISLRDNQPGIIVIS